MEIEIFHIGQCVVLTSSGRTWMRGMLMTMRDGGETLEAGEELLLGL